MVTELLLNWSWWCQYGILGPPVQTKAASLEGDYMPELGDVYDPPEPHLEPNDEHGRKMESLVCSLPELQRIIIKAKYIQYPYQGHHAIAQKLKISIDRFESELSRTKELLWRRWNNEVRHGSHNDAENSQRVV